MDKLKERIGLGKDDDKDKKHGQEKNNQGGPGGHQQNVLVGGERKAPGDAQRQQGGGGNNAKSRIKRGLCWPVENKKDEPSRFTRPGSNVSWYYNWSPHPTKGTDGLQFVPMQWNAGGIQELSENVKRADAKAVMAFNEPELPDQANMDAKVAADEWMKHIQPLRKQGVRCGSPAITNAGHSVQWMKDFHERIKREGSDVDFWCFHWYGPELGPFYDHLWSTHAQLDNNKPVWITEFAATNWNEQSPLPREQVEKFAKESFKYLDSLDWVERYCWFAPTRDIGNVGKWARMYNDEGNLTDLGRAYRDE